MGGTLSFALKIAKMRMSVSPGVNNSRTAQRMFMKVSSGDFHCSFSSHTNSDYSETAITDTSHEDLRLFLR